MQLGPPTLIAFIGAEVRENSSRPFRVCDAWEDARVELQLRILKLLDCIAELEKIDVGKQASTLIGTCCVCSRILMEKAMLLSCGGSLTTDEIQQGISAHNDFLSLPIVQAVKKRESSPKTLFFGGRELKYIRNMELRLEVIRRFSDSRPEMLFRNSIYHLAPVEADSGAAADLLDLEITDTRVLGDAANGTNYVRRHLIWLSEFFRLRLNAEIHELGKEADSLRDAGDYHYEVLANIARFVSTAFLQMRTNDAQYVLTQPRFVALANSIEACSSRIDELKAELGEFLRNAKSSESAFQNGDDLKLRHRLYEDISEVPFLLAAVSRQLLNRPSFAELFSTGASPSMSLRVVCYPSADSRNGSIIIAQCLDIDMVAAGKSVDAALHDLDVILHAWMVEFRTSQHGWIHPSVAPARFHAAFTDGKSLVLFPCELTNGVNLQVRYFDEPVPRSYKMSAQMLGCTNK